jgi:hypothetical protein
MEKMSRIQAAIRSMNTFPETNIPALAKTARLAAITVATLFIGLSLFGIFGVWLVERGAAEIALKGFGLIENAVGVVDAGVGRAENLIATCRTEVRQAAETISAAGAQAEANSPMLSALHERLEARLAPRIAQIQQALAPVRDAVGAIANTVSLVSALPMMADRAPRLEALNESFQRLEGLSVDSTQLRSTLRTLAIAKATDLPPETVATLNGLAQRIDTQLGEVQANVQGVQADIAALQARLDARKSRVLFLCTLLAVLASLMLAWILYTQIVVIRHHRSCVRGLADKPTNDRLH